MIRWKMVMWLGRTTLLAMVLLVVSNTAWALPGFGQGGIEDGYASGLDVLATDDFAAIAGKRVGVITNHTARDRAGTGLVTLLQHSANVRLVAIFSPEHGITGQLDQKIASGVDAGSGLPVYSLYGDHKRPTAEMLTGVDVLVFDIQDVGTRFYTYVTTMAYAMEVAAQHGVAFYVLDRPNPITASAVQGPVLDAELKSFIGYFPLPLRHGMTVGELARMFNQENQIGADLTVVPMRGYQRERWLDQLGLSWVNPSPNLRTLNQAILYPGVAMVESANVSVGRGTDTPFELLGAPWLQADALAAWLNARAIDGVRFHPARFTPTAWPYRGKPCEGVRIELLSREALDVARLGLELADALTRFGQGQFQLERTVGMIGSRDTVARLRQGEDPTLIMQQWQPALTTFTQQRQRYLLY